MSAAKISKSEELQKQTCEVLKMMCRANGLKVSGNKSELVARLTHPTADGLAADRRVLPRVRLAPVAVPVAVPVAAEVDDEADDEVKVDDAEPVQPRGFEQLKLEVLQLTLPDLFKMEKRILAEIESRTKGVSAGPRVSRPMNPGFKKHNMWCRFVQADGIKKGWDAFTYAQRCKVDGEMKTVEVAALASIEHEGQYIYPDSVSKQKPNGETLTLNQAMGLAKQYWSAKEKKGAKLELYQEFEAQYNGGAIEVVAKQVKTTRTMAELRAEQAAAAAAAAAAHAAKMAENKEKRDAERDLRQLVKASANAAFKTIKLVAKKEEWSCPNDEQVYPFEFKGNKFLRNFDNEIWADDNGQLGEWVGKWDVAANTIAATADRDAE